MDWLDLTYFAAAAEELSFTSAAARLNVTHPAVSQRIGRFERRLRVPLFKRSSRGVTLTPAGRELLPRAREMLTLHEETQRALSQVHKRGAVRVAFGTVEIRSHRLVPFVERALGWDLDWVTDATPGLVDQVATGALAAALCAQFPGELVRVPDGCGVMTVAHDPIWVMVAAGEAQRRSVTLEDLRGRTWIVSPPSQHPHGWETALLDGLGMAWIATSQRPGRRLIAAGDAVAFGSALSRPGGDTAMLPLAPPLTRHLYLLWGSALPLAEATRLRAGLADYYRSQVDLVPGLRAAVSAGV